MKKIKNPDFLTLRKKVDLIVKYLGNNITEKTFPDYTSINWTQEDRFFDDGQVMILRLKSEKSAQYIVKYEDETMSFYDSTDEAESFISNDKEFDTIFNSLVRRALGEIECVLEEDVDPFVELRHRAEEILLKCGEATEIKGIPIIEYDVAAMQFCKTNKGFDDIMLIRCVNKAGNGYNDVFVWSYSKNRIREFCVDDDEWPASMQVIWGLTSIA